MRSFFIAPGISTSAPRRLIDTSECRLAAPQSAPIPGSKITLQDARVRVPKTCSGLKHTSNSPELTHAYQ